MIGVRLGVGHHFSGGFDSSASAFFAATGITGATEQQAVNTLVTSLKSAGLWSKMKAVYPFVTDQRNLASFSEDFSNAAWSKTDTTVTANATIAPDGTTTADRLIESATTNTHRIFQSITTSGTNTYSIYVKYNGRQYFGIRFFADASQYSSQLFDVQNGVIGNKLELGITSTAAMTSVGNGWYRCSISANVSSINMLTFLSNTNTVNDVVGNIYLGDGTSGVFIWGAQAELGTLTTYQPQLGSAQSAISNQFKYNLVNPVDSDAAFRGVFNGGWTFSNQGALPNGTNGYMDTFFNPNSSLTYNSAHISFYSRTNNETTGSSTMGAVDGTNNEIRLILRRPTNLGYFLSTDSSNGILDYTINNSTGLFIGNANGVNVRKLIRNGSVLTPLSQVPRGLGIWPAVKIYIGSRSLLNNAGEYDNKQCAFSSIGDGLTDTEATAFYNAVQTFQTTLNRQIAP